MRKDSDAVLIDTRTKMEYDEGHMPDAQLIDIMDPQFREKIDALDRNKSYYMYCRSGNRSGQACKMMLKMGFEKVYNLQSGVLDWDEPLTTE
ncbi:MAG: rhodanese [Ectothiorhodospiraceae bacterium]|nr:rhodanese [Ectothiorhodospiraceae bacterium]